MFVSVTDQDGSKILVNSDHIIEIQDDEGDCKITVTGRDVYLYPQESFADLCERLQQ